MGRKLNGFGFWALIFLIPGTGFAQPNVSIEVTPPPAPESAQKDIAEIQKHRATYERGKNLLTAPPLTATPQPEDTPLQERKDAAMERRQQFKSNKLEIQKDRKEKSKRSNRNWTGKRRK